MSRKCRIVVVGARGRLGSPLSADLAAAGYHVTRLFRSDLDVTEPVQVAAAVEGLRPDVIVNCTAYNAVDAAEAHPETAFAVNAAAPATMAEAARRVNAVLVHYGSDFVFDGCAASPYAEDAATNPLSVYGASKLAGEEAVRSLPEHYILRVESLFGGRDAAGHKTTV